MSLPPFEKELLYDEYWSLWQSTKLPNYLERLAREELKQSNPKIKHEISIKILMEKLVFKIQKYINFAENREV